MILFATRAHRRASALHLIAATVLATVASTQLFAHGGGGDIALYDDNGKIGIGFAELDDDDINQVFFDPNDIVHQSILLPQPPIPTIPFDFGSSEPGFDADEFSLTPNSAVTVNPLSLSYWDGIGAVDFQPSVDTSADYSPSTIMSTDGDGGFHAHPVMGLSSTAGTVADGVYVAEFSVSVPGMTDSDPFYLVAMVDELINNSSDPEGSAEMLGELIRNYQADPLNAPAPMYEGKDFTFYAEAVAVVEAQVPEPGFMGLSTLATLGLLGARLRRRTR
ncbi:MAG: PEP-CTERM sorting domain-containing protein [Planctomycetota bacterium]